MAYIACSLRCHGNRWCHIEAAAQYLHATRRLYQSPMNTSYTSVYIYTQLHVYVLRDEATATQVSADERLVSRIRLDIEEQETGDDYKANHVTDCLPYITVTTAEERTKTGNCCCRCCYWCAVATLATNATAAPCDKRANHTRQMSSAHRASLRLFLVPPSPVSLVPAAAAAQPCLYKPASPSLHHSGCTSSSNAASSRRH